MFSLINKAPTRESRRFAFVIGHRLSYHTVSYGGLGYDIVEYYHSILENVLSSLNA